MQVLQTAVSRLGVAGVRTFVLSLEGCCEEFLRKLGYTPAWMSLRPKVEPVRKTRIFEKDRKTSGQFRAQAVAGRVF